MSQRAIQISWDELVIRAWADEALSLGLFLKNGVAQWVFAGDEGRIYLMAYLPGVAWAMCHEAIRHDSDIHISVYVSPNHRRQGIGNEISQLVQDAWYAGQPLKSEVIDVGA